MGFSVEKITVRCPRCGTGIKVNPEVESVDMQWTGTDTETKAPLWTVRVFFQKQVNATDHKCIFTDGKNPIERFVDTGKLDGR